jgi:NAD(P)-dependent dehydrogenase (short-subunit alcohol dehydrogenase family)
MHDLNGKTALVTGASKGIGAAVARRLGEAGAHVIAHYNSDEAGAREATAGIEEERRALIRADLGEPDGAVRLWKEALAWRGRIDVVVDNAAVLRRSPLEAPDSDWKEAWGEILQTNVVSATTLMRDAVGHFRENGGGVLVVLSSWNAQRGTGILDLIAYSASKAAVKAAAQTLAQTYAADGVLVYVIAPGVVNTQMSVDAARDNGGEEAVTASLAMREWVPPAEIADLTAYLASGACRHLTGATLDVNGASYLR